MHIGSRKHRLPNFFFFTLALFHHSWYNVHNHWIWRPIMNHSIVAAQFYFYYYFFMNKR